MTDEEMLEIAERKKQRGRETYNTGVVAYVGSGYDEPREGGSEAARARMIARQMTNPERMAEEAKQRREAEAAAAKERDRLARLHPMERAAEKAKAEEAARLEKWAQLNGWRSYAEYEAEQQRKRNRR